MSTAPLARKETMPELLAKADELAELALTAQNEEEFLVVAQTLSRTHEVEIPRKLDAFAWLLDKLDSEVQALGEMIEDIRAVIDSRKKKAQRVRELLAYCTSRAGGRIEGHIHTARMQKAADELYFDMRVLPLEYIRIAEPRMDVDKPKLRRDLQAKIHVPGAGLIGTDKVLRIDPNARKREERKGN